MHAPIILTMQSIYIRESVKVYEEGFTLPSIHIGFEELSEGEPTKLTQNGCQGLNSFVIHTWLMCDHTL